MRANEVAAAIHADMCDDDRNGYSWSPRQGGDHPDGWKTLSLDGRDYSYPLGSWDCSSSAIKAWELALGMSLGCSTTHDMRAAFLATGLFEWKPMSFTADVGDLYLAEQSHVAMCQSQVPDTLSEFCINENGGVYGGQVGDQTGWEAYVHGYYDFPWDGILHYVGGETPQPAQQQAGPEPAQVAAKPKEPCYRVFRDGKWRAWKCAGQTAGKEGSDVYDIDFDDLGPDGWFQITLEDGTVLPKNKCNELRGKRVMGVTVYYDTPGATPGNYYEAVYRVHPKGCDWLKWEHDDDDDGAGDDAHPIDMFQLKLGHVGGM